MKVTILIIILSLALGNLVFASDQYDHQIDRIFKEPSGDSKVIYKIPIEVKMLDFTEDANWYKVKVEFKLGIAKLQYIGWTYIPIGKILRKRAGL